jgi:hypothetical protein
MKKTIIITCLSSLLLIQCGSESTPFLIKQGSIGELTKEIQMKQIDSIFAQDSIVRVNNLDNYSGTNGDIEIYEKGGNKLLLLSPAKINDVNAVISDIQVFDNRYITEKGLHLDSTFKSIKDNYDIANIETTISSVVIFLIDSDIYLTIDKQELPENLRYNPNVKVEESQIPDEARIKYFMISWDTEIQP